jgi:hypothetical protein
LTHLQGNNNNSKRGPYKLPERMRAMHDIRSLLIEGYTYAAIMEQLQIEHRTFYRLLNALFEDDRRLLAENIDDTEFLNQMALCRDRLLEQRRELLEMARNSDIDPQVRINAYHLIAEIASAVFKIYEGGPAWLAARHRFPKTSLTGPTSRGARLVLTKKDNNIENDDDDDSVVRMMPPPRYKKEEEESRWR